MLIGALVARYLLVIPLCDLGNLESFSSYHEKVIKCPRTILNVTDIIWH